MSAPRVMQAPIGPATTTDLVAAVCAAGGLGTLAASWTPPGDLRAQVEDLQRAQDRPFCVNLVLAFDQHERLEVLVEAHVPAISFSWGTDSAMIARARTAGASVFVQVGDVEAGLRAVSAGAEVLIAQGVEAGGHVQSELPLVQLVRELTARTSVPVLAAGGISSDRSAQAVLLAGAAGVAVGSAYLVATEADVHPTYRDLVCRAAGSDTILSGVFDIGWPDAPHRTLRNSTIDAWLQAGRPPRGQRPGEGQQVAVRAGEAIERYSDAQPTRETVGDISAMALYAGCGIDTVTEPTDASSITEHMMSAFHPHEPHDPGASTPNIP